MLSRSCKGREEGRAGGRGVVRVVDAHGVGVTSHLTLHYITFMHSADAFIQSDFPERAPNIASSLKNVGVTEGSGSGGG